LTFSLVVPIYRNEGSIPELLARLADLDRRLAGGLEAVLVVDGSPDRSEEILLERLPQARLKAQVVALSRNFGSFAAIRAGLAAGTGEFFGVMAADLQEPGDLVLEFRDALAAGGCDVVVASRRERADPFLSRLLSRVFWSGYRALVWAEFPERGIDVFACTRAFRDHLLALEEKRSTLVGLVFWLGFRRCEIGYDRLPRRHGRSAWSLGRKLRYLLDSVFAFSELPIRLLEAVGALGLLLSLVLGLVVAVARLGGSIEVPGYTATVLLVMFFGGLNSLGLGLIGEYAWRAFENTKGRPEYLVARRAAFPGTGAVGAAGEGA
jgi:polyisoprenyl-phosphate glycosyltransferase